ncbi:class I SAM-dependent methyltransferase [Pedobacter arcticus]|uniref:class I SAM-dependent methyltransferase n=1 Tax=Pedobacter arcticus TaxID=752140 RepID=UPI00031F15E2|nr:class I SAM-dependent methyltransferase [Pedobacter arcticus]
MTKSQIRSYFQKLNDLNEEQKLYLEIHAKRFEIILNWSNNKNFSSVLDIGPSFLSELLFARFNEKLSIMGFNATESLGGHLASPNIFKQANFIQQDLNFLDAKMLHQKFDLIVCAEVIEHLYTSPKCLIQQLSQMLNADGYLLIQTPNAVSLRKRLSFLTGKNPFEIPRENLKNPGHYREYTAKELKQLAAQSGFTVEKLILDEYFEYPSTISRIYRTFKNIIPPTLRSGITIILKKEPHPQSFSEGEGSVGEETAEREA